MVDVLFSFLCVLISIRCLGCSFKEIFRTLKDFLLLLVVTSALIIYAFRVQRMGLVALSNTDYGKYFRQVPERKILRRKRLSSSAYILSSFVRYYSVADTL